MKLILSQTKIEELVQIQFISLTMNCAEINNQNDRNHCCCYEPLVNHCHAFTITHTCSSNSLSLITLIDNLWNWMQFVFLQADKIPIRSEIFPVAGTIGWHWLIQLPRYTGHWPVTGPGVPGPTQPLSSEETGHWPLVPGVHTPYPASDWHVTPPGLWDKVSQIF